MFFYCLNADTTSSSGNCCFCENVCNPATCSCNKFPSLTSCTRRRCCYVGALCRPCQLPLCAGLVKEKEYNDQYGFGLQTTMDLKRKTFIGCYEGVFSTEEPQDTTYVMQVPTGYLDAIDDVKGNLTRYMNHEAIDPNVVLEIWTNIHGEYVPLFFSSQKIKKGSFLYFRYSISHSFQQQRRKQTYKDN